MAAFGQLIENIRMQMRAGLLPLQPIAEEYGMYSPHRTYVLRP